MKQPFQKFLFLMLILSFAALDHAGAQAPPPANDLFENAIELNGPLPITVQGSNVGATRETGEQWYGYSYPSSQSIWWKWKPSQAGYYSIDTHGSSVDTILGVYTGWVVWNLTSFRWNNDDRDIPTSRVTIFANPEYTYSIAVDSFPRSPGGQIVLNISRVPDAPNDLLASAINLSGTLPLNIIGTTYGAGLELGEAHPYFDEYSVWWTWTAPTTGTYYLAPTFPNSVLLGLFRGRSYAQADRIALGTQGFKFQATAGTLYSIQAIQGSDYIGTDEFEFRLRTFVPPPNDNLNTATALSGLLPLEVQGTTLDASSEAGEISTRRSVWYRWIPAHSGSLEIVTKRLGLDADNYPVPEVFIAGPEGGVANLEPFFLNPQKKSFLTPSVVAGTVYYIRVTEKNTGPMNGEFSLTLRTGPTIPENNAFETATTLTAAYPTTYSGSIAGATRESGDPGTGSTVWYRWTAPSTGPVAIRLAPTNNTSTKEYVYEGTSRDTMVLQSVDQSGRYHLQADVTYMIGVDGEQLTLKSGQFLIFIANPPPNDLIANAIEIQGDLPLTFQGSTLAAGLEDDDPIYPPLLGYIEPRRTAWWTWTPRVSGQYTFTAAGTPTVNGDGHHVVSVYASSPTVSSNAIIRKYDKSAVLTAIAGTKYFLSIDSYEPSNFQVMLAPSPANDNLENAKTISISAGLNSAESSLAGATTESKELHQRLQQSVWFTFTAPSEPVPLQFRITPTNADTSPNLFSIGIFSGENYQSSTWQIEGLHRGSLDFTPKPNTTYNIRVAGSFVEPNEAKFTLYAATTPANDRIEAATVLPSMGSCSANGWSLSATADEIEPVPVSTRFRGLAANSVWWKITPIDADLITVDTMGSSFDTVLRAWTGPSLTQLTLVSECDEASSTNHASRVAFVPTADQTYYFQVVGARVHEKGTVKLNISHTPSPTTLADFKKWARADIESRTEAGLIAAVAHLTAAVGLAPNDAEANFLLALARISEMQQKPEFITLMNRWGFSTKRNGLVNPRYTAPLDAVGRPITAPGASTEQALAYANATALPELTFAEEALAKAATAGLNLELSDAETGLRFMLADLADVQIVRSIGRLLEAAIRLDNTWDADLTLADIYSIKKGTRYDGQKLLQLAPKALTKRDKEQRTAFKTAYQAANARYQDGRTALLDRTPSPFDRRHLFYLSEKSDHREAEWADSASKISSALDAPTFWDGVMVDLRPLLNSETGPRALLPKLRGTKALPLTAADPTLGGVWAGNTLTGLDALIKDNRMLYDTASFLAFMQTFVGLHAPPDSLDPNGDLDDDGLTNFAEYVFALDPKAANSESEFQAHGLQRALSDGQDHFTISFVRLSNQSTLQYKVLLSDDFVTWDRSETQLEAIAASPNADGVSETVTYRLKAPATEDGYKFVKIEVTSP